MAVLISFVNELDMHQMAEICDAAILLARPRRPSQLWCDDFLKWQCGEAAAAWSRSMNNQ